MRRNTPEQEPYRRAVSRPVREAISELAQLDAETAASITPIQLLGVMMRVVLKDRVTSEEIDQICTAYYYAMKEFSRL